MGDPFVPPIDLFDKCDSDQGYFGYFRKRGDHYFSQPLLDPIVGPTTIFEGQTCVQWSTNNYLGLAENEEIRRAAVKAAKVYGPAAPMGSRMLTGNTQHHIEFEHQLADFLDKEAAVLCNYGYLGVLGTLNALVQKGDTIVLDKRSHASMVDGALGAQGRFRVYRHNDMDSLEKHLRRVNRDRKGGVLIVCEGVFGMDGDLANLPDICMLKDKYDARLFIDDAHGFGVMGENGQGTASHFGVQDRVEVYFGTFAKAFAGIGGVTASENRVVDWIRYNARTQVFAKSLPMIYVKAMSKALELIRNSRDRRQRMWVNARKLKDGLREVGYRVGAVESPITPVYLPAGDMQVGMRIVRRLRDKGIFVTGVMYPVVPKKTILLRMIPTASHTEEDIQRTVDAYRGLRDELKLDLKPVGTEG